MNAPLNFPETKNRSLKPARRPGFKLAIGLASVCLGAGLLLPAIKNGFWHPHRVPAGQFQADMRTMVAEVRYLLAPEPDFKNPPARFDGRPVTFEQHAPGDALTSASAQI